MDPLRRKLYSVLSAHRTFVAFGLYGLVTALGYALAYTVRFELSWNPDYTSTFLATLPLLVASRLFSDAVFSLAAGRWRYVGVSDVFRLAGAMTAGSLVFMGLLAAVPLPTRVPRSILLLELMLTTLLTAAAWLTYRTSFQMMRRRTQSADRAALRTLVIGAGEAGSRLAHEMVSYPTTYVPVGFIDDDPRKWGMRIQGLPVIGSVRGLDAIARETGVDVLIIALPSAQPSQLRRIVEACEATRMPYKVLPGISEVFEGKIRVNQLRDIEIEDLLGREPVRLSIPELAEDFADRCILITGAAGSIGSELSRQVARHHPARLVLLDQAESALYFLERELEAEYPELELLTLVGDVVDEVLLEDIFSRHGPGRVFHAAAYKHVPMMENNPREAVRNNVIGTELVARVAGRHGCERFVLISTDKAVHPGNVMGATKSLAEHVIMAAGRHFEGTGYLAVRFGNVLGSQGSVIPLFKQQMEHGKPLTVTHPDATRFFMTIPEAVQLVLQASLLPEASGRIAMLDMGQPVRILDLARNLIRLSSDFIDPDSRITYVGLRPGEKLHEELHTEDEKLLNTEIGKVFLLAQTTAEPTAELRGWVERWVGEIDDPVVRERLESVWAWCTGEAVEKPSRDIPTIRPVNRVSGA